jgi:thioredoxin 1
MPAGAIIFLTIIGLFLFWNFSLRLRGRKQKGKQAPLVKGRLGKAIARKEKVVAYFYTPTCRACRTQERYLPEIQKKFPNIIRIDASKQLEIAREFGVMGTPTIVVIDEGIIKDYFVGITPPHKILQSLNGD